MMPKENSCYMTPLHKAAMEGNFSEFKAIIDHVEDKNPQNNRGETPLHLAARKGHSLICQLIVDNIQDKNPKVYCTKMNLNKKLGTSSGIGVTNP